MESFAIAINREAYRNQLRYHRMVIFLTVVLTSLVPDYGMAETQEGWYTHTFGERTCELSPIATPSLPESIPEYTKLDPDTTMHVTGTARVIDVKDYTLEVSGNVTHPLKLSYDDLRCLPRVSSRSTIVCPGFFEDTATWAGTPFRDVLALAAPLDDATHLRLVSEDGYSSLVSIEEAGGDGNYLAYEWEGEPIPVLHGFPVRAVFPELNGNKWVKWLVRIEVQ